MIPFDKLDFINPFIHRMPKKSSLAEAIVKGDLYKTRKFGKKNCLTKEGVKELIHNRKRFGYCHRLKKISDMFLGKDNKAFPLSFLTESIKEQVENYKWKMQSMIEAGKPFVDYTNNIIANEQEKKI